MLRYNFTVAVLMAAMAIMCFAGGLYIAGSFSTLVVIYCIVSYFKWRTRQNRSGYR